LILVLGIVPYYIEASGTPTTSTKGLKMNRAKTYTKLIDVETGEVFAACELTPAAVKRLIKQYQTFGYYLKEAI
jgi:hypothetical protein